MSKFPMLFRGPKLPTPRGLKTGAMGTILLLPALNILGVLVMFVLGKESKLVNPFLWALVGLAALDGVYRLLRRIWRRY